MTFLRRENLFEFKVFDGIVQSTYFGVDEGKPYLETLGVILWNQSHQVK